jgi:hypothetical protein
MSDRGVAYQREPLRVIERLHSQVNIKLRPIEMMSRREFYVEELADLRIPKPWKLFERNKHLPVMD